MEEIKNWTKMAVTKPVIWDNPRDRASATANISGHYCGKLMTDISNELFNESDPDLSHLDWYDFSFNHNRYDIFIVKKIDTIEEVV